MANLELEEYLVFTIPLHYNIHLMFFLLWDRKANKILSERLDCACSDTRPRDGICTNVYLRMYVDLPKLEYKIY